MLGVNESIISSFLSLIYNASGTGLTLLLVGNLQSLLYHKPAIIMFRII